MRTNLAKKNCASAWPTKLKPVITDAARLIAVMIGDSDSVIGMTIREIAVRETTTIVTAIVIVTVIVIVIVMIVIEIEIVTGIKDTGRLVLAMLTMKAKDRTQNLTLTLRPLLRLLQM